MLHTGDPITLVSVTHTCVCLWGTGVCGGLWGVGVQIWFLLEFL